MPRGYEDNDPAKGKPHRRVREKITLLLTEDTGLDPDLLKAALWRVADKRPEEVLDALAWVLGARADLSSGNVRGLAESLVQVHAGETAPALTLTEEELARAYEAVSAGEQETASGAPVTNLGSLEEELARADAAAVLDDDIDDEEEP